MKKIFVFVIFLLAHSFCIAAQQPVSPVAEPYNFGKYRADQNTNNAATQANFTELYGSVGTLTSGLANKANSSCFADATAMASCFPSLTVGGSWGNISGSITSQTDLSSALSGKESTLGNPSTSGYVLSSTTAGVRSWVPMTGGTFDQAGDYTLSGSVGFTGPVDFTGASVTGLSGGSMVYPSSAGVAVYGGSSTWGSSLSVGTSANNLVQLNSSAQLPAVSAALLTNFPTLNQNTTGNAGTATRLATTRTISGVSFDGSANINLALSALSDDSTHRLVTDTEKNNWNAKEAFLGNPETSGWCLQSTTSGVRSWGVCGSGTSLPTGTEGDFYRVGASGAETVTPLTPVAGQSITLPVVGDTVTINAWGDDTAYGTSWNGSTKPVSQNAVYDKIESMGSGGTTTISGLTDWPAGVTATELSYIDGATSNLQAQISAISAGSGGIVTAITYEPYSDVACTGAKYDTVANRFYPCIGGYHTAYLSGTAFSKPTPAQTCNTQSLLLNKSGVRDGVSNIYSADGIVGIKVTGNGKALHSVVFKSATDNGTSAYYTVNVNTSTVFSGNVTDSFSIITPGSVDTEFTGVSSTKPVLADGTTYYIGINSSASHWENRVSLQTISDPANQNLYVGLTGIDSMVQAVGNGKSLWAKVYVCD